MIKHTLKMAGCLLFCALLGAGGLSFYVLPQKEYSDLENRLLQTRPEFVLEDLQNGSYQEHYETYLNDQMPGRDKWVRAAANMQQFIGKKDINGVYLGKDGYLLEKFDASAYDPAQAQENITYLSQFLNNAIQQYGSDRVCCIILPDKAGAMPGKLPDKAGGSNAQQADTIARLQKSLDDPGILLDMQPELFKHQEEPIYYRTDHHWTTLGAYYAYAAWAAQTKREAPKLADYERTVLFDDFYGTTYNKVHSKVPADSVELFYHPNQDGVKVDIDHGDAISDSFYFKKAAVEGFNRYNVFLSKNTASIEITTKAKTGRSLLLVKDSYANCFVPFLAGDYEKIWMVDCRYSKQNVRDLLAEQTEITDVMVMYQANKFMQDTDLKALDEEAKQMETFDADSFFNE